MGRIIPFFAVLIFLVPRLAAQSSLDRNDFPERIEEPSLKNKPVRQSAKAAEQAQARAPIEGPWVTYEQVMAHPDDIGLNYRYALSQVRGGNLRSASATLERILMVNPNLPKVRLVYAVVLYRLDNLDDAERELNALKPEEMPATLRAEVEDYLRRIRGRRRKSHFIAVLGLGLEYDDNRNAAPSSGRRLFFDTPITLTSDSTRKGDVAKLFLGSLGFTQDLGYQAGHQLFADYSYYRAEQTTQKILNLQNHFADLGVVYKGRWADVTPSFEFDHLLLAQTTYLRSRGARLRLEHKITPRLGPFLETAYTRQEYNRTAVVPDGEKRTGDKIEGGGGFNYALSPTMNVLVGYTHVEQGAAAKFDAYHRDGFTVAHTWLLGKGQFLLSSAIFNLDRYKDPDIIVSTTNRRDDTLRAFATYGLPMTFLSPSLSDLVWTFTYEYYQARSSLLNYSYTNNKGSTLLTYKWEL